MKRRGPEKPPTIALRSMEEGVCACGVCVRVLFVELDDSGTIFDANVDGTVLAIPQMNSADCLEHELVYICDDCLRKLYLQSKGL